MSPSAKVVLHQSQRGHSPSYGTYTSYDSADASAAEVRYRYSDAEEYLYAPRNGSSSSSSISISSSSSRFGNKDRDTRVHQSGAVVSQPDADGIESEAPTAGSGANAGYYRRHRDQSV